MVFLIRTCLLAGLALVALNELAAVRGGDEKPKVKVEFRRAETEPAKDLTEAVIPGSNKKIYLHKTTEITNADIAEARAAKDNGKSAVEIVFTAEGAKKIADLSKAHTGKPLAILLNGKVLSAPTIRDPIGPRAMITGELTPADVDRIVKGVTGK
ncbi:MAG: hypothetical protein HY040_22390 [Planctomycetes bacterium]|nr:hypothetical protein [Planctomycetota bacterium]